MLQKFNFNQIPESLQPHSKHHLETYLEHCTTQNLQPVNHHEFFQHAPRVFAVSDFVADTANRYPQLLNELFQEKLIHSVLNKKDYSKIFKQLNQTITDRESCMRQLRLLRRKHLLRIIWLDITDQFSAWELMRDWSDFADGCVQFALQWLTTEYQQKYGLPKNRHGKTQELSVIALGKLGGCELNWSSDIDLMFAYEEEGETESEHNSITHAQYFMRLAQDLIKLLNQVTAEGFVFRVDLRLRPHGATSALVLPLAAIQNYYTSSARDWERYALLRARILTGNSTIVEALKKMINHFVYKAELDYGTLEPLRELQKKIDSENKIKGSEKDLKRGIGGIRQVEFIVQTQQLISGGEHRLLHTSSIQQAFEALQEEQLMDAKKINELKQAYIFLRRTEHMLQALQDRQIHHLPENSPDQKKLAYALNFSDYAAFLSFLDVHRVMVKDYYQQLLARPSFDSIDENFELKKDIALSWEHPERENISALSEMGYQTPANALALLKNLQEGLTLGRKHEEQLNTLLPILLMAIANQTDDPDLILFRVLKVIQVVAKRNIFLSLLIENPKALSQLIKLCAMSPWIADLLVNYPQLLGQLIDSKRLYAPLDLKTLEKKCERLLEIHQDESLENKIELLAKFKLIHLLKVAAMDITGVLPMMRVSDHLSNLATVILRMMSQLAIEKIKAETHCKIDFKKLKQAFLIIGYGKLGGLELGYSSDLDLVFLYDDKTFKSIKNFNAELFFTQVSRQITNFLQMLTKNGKLYTADLRLRPQGESGLLVNSLAAFEHYQTHNAWTWEHQAIVRARTIAAEESRSNRFDEIRYKILTQKRNVETLKNDVKAMREKMRSTHKTIAENMFDIKYSVGGVIDIEFIVQFFALAYSQQFPKLIEYTDNIRILERLIYGEIMPVAEVQLLSDAYRAYRATLHRLDLLQQEAVVPIAQFRSYRDGVIDIWRHYLEN